MTRARTRMARSRKRRDDQVMFLILAAFFIVASATAVLAFFWVRSLLSPTSGPDPSGPSFSNGGQQPGGEDSNVPMPVGPLQSEAGPTAAPWDGVSRVTILFMGLDYRDWSEGTDIPRTDSMILLSIDPMSKTAGMISIPRDLWVNVPGMGYNKINTAYRWGELYKLPGGGPGLAMQSVEGFLGVPIDYYAMVDFNTFVRMIDEMGGLDMHIKEEIVVDPIGPGNTVTLEPGVQTLDGATVLAYARQRHTANDDFDRSARQQEVIMAIREQVLQFNMLPTLITKAPRLYQEVAAGVSTNLTLDQIVRLAMLAVQIPETNLKKGVIGPPSQVEFATNPEDGQAILIPVPDQIRILRDDIFASGGPVAPAAMQANAQITATASIPTPEADLETLMREEKARVLVSNGTATAGLASKTSELLKEMGVTVVGEKNADQAMANTTIYLSTGKPYTVRFLIEELNLPETRILYRSEPDPQADIEIILGADWADQQ